MLKIEEKAQRRDIGRNVLNSVLLVNRWGRSYCRCLREGLHGAVALWQSDCELGNTKDKEGCMELGEEHTFIFNKKAP